MHGQIDLRTILGLDRYCCWMLATEREGSASFVESEREGKEMLVEKRI